MIPFKQIIKIVFFSFLLTACSDLYLGKVYYSQGKFAKSYDELIILSDKGFPEASYYIGRMIEEKKIKDKKPEECVEFYEKSYEQGYKPAASRLGFFYLKKEDNENALKWLEIADKSGDKNAKIALIKLKLTIGNEEEKKEILSKLNNTESNDADYMYLKGEIYEKGYAGQINLNKAEYYYGKSYERGNIKAGLKYGSLLEKQNKYEEALKVYEDIFDKSEIPVAAYRAGRIYENRARNIKLYYCPVTKAKTSKEYYLMKSDSINVKNDFYDKAVNWYEKAQNLPAAQYRIKRIKWYKEEKRCGEYEIIEKYVKENVNEAIRDYVKLYQSGSCSSNQITTGSFVTEEKQINSLYLNPDNETVEKDTLKYYLRLAKHYEFDKLNINKAKEYYEKACYFISPEAEISLARLNKDNNTDVSAAVFYYYSQKEDPQAMYYLGTLYFDLKDNEKAVYWLKKSTKTRYFPALKTLTDYYFEKENNKSVVKYLESLTDIYPCFVNVKLGEVYEGGYDLEPDLEKAEMYYERALILKCPEAYYRLAWFYFYKQNSEDNLVKAKDLIEEYILTVKQEKPKAYRLLGRIYAQLGNQDEAIKYLFKATRLGYVITTDEVRLLLTKYKKIENIFPVDSGGKPLVYLSEFISKRDLKASLCFAYKAAKQNVDRGGLLLLKMGIRIKDKNTFNFLNNIQKNPKICDEYLRKKFNSNK